MKAWCRVLPLLLVQLFLLSPSSATTSASASLLTRVNAILMKSEAFRALERQQNDLKMGGQDGGGGDFAEAEFSYFLSMQINRILSIKDILRTLDALTEADLRQLADMLPGSTSRQKVCLVQASAPQTINCGDRPYRIAVQFAEWQTKTDDDKRSWVADELFKALGYSEKAVRTAKVRLIMSLLSSKPEEFHRLDIVSISKDGSAIATMNGITQRPVRVQINPAPGAPGPGRYRIAIEGVDEARNGVYTLDSSSPLFDVDICQNKNSQLGFVVNHGRELFYREMKPLAEQCVRRFKEGRKNSAIWISSQTKLILHCR